MGKVNYTPTKVVLEIPDLIIHDTVIKRKAKMFGLSYNQADETVTVSWTVEHYASNNGIYGDYLGKQIPNKLKETIADNTVTVDAETGEIINPEDYAVVSMVNGNLITPQPYTVVTGQELITPDPYTDESGNLITPDPYYQDTVETITPDPYYEQVEQITYTIEWMGQYDFFNMVAEESTINVHNLIRHYGMQADWIYNLK